MNADSKKPQVAMVQVYLGSFADSILDYREQAEVVDRVRMRDDMRDGLRALSETARQHGVRNYGSFMDAGYRGMYNMRLSELESLKGVPRGERLLDRMGRTELAANYLRVTLTDDRIRVEDVHGQVALEHTAHDVGQIVRDTVIKGSGRRPEDFPLAEHINESKKTLKAAGKKLKEIGPEEADDEIVFLAATTSMMSDPGYTKDPEEDDSVPDAEPPSSS
jgi:DNA-damage-inducible protein D